MKKIFSGKEIDAYCINDNFDSSTTIIYFDHLGGRKNNTEYLGDSETRAAGPARAFGRLGVKLVIVIALRGHWYQTEEVECLLRSMKANDKSHVKYFHVGYSMGGFAAINFAYINDAKVLAFQPQCRLGRDVPMTTAYKECFSKVLQGKFEENITKRLCSEIDGFIFFDNHNEIDSWHANQISCLTKLKPIVVPYSGHGSSLVVNRTYKISQVLKEFYEGTFTREYFYSKFDVTKTDEYIAHEAKEALSSLKNLASSKDLRSKLVISYDSGCYNYGLEVILSTRWDLVKFSYDDIKLVIRILLKNRNFTDLISVLVKIQKSMLSLDLKIENLIYVGLGVANHCLSNSALGNDFLRKAIQIDNSDYFVVWHIYKYLGLEAEDYIQKNATKAQINALKV